MVGTAVMISINLVNKKAKKACAGITWLNLLIRRKAQIAFNCPSLVKTNRSLINSG